LAHEYGHVSWWDIFVPQPGGGLDPSKTATFCEGKFYTSGSWPPGQGTKVDLPEKRWVGFGDIRLQPSGSEVLKLRKFLRQGEHGNAAASLARIYRSRKWASALAAFSPDEYFAETFELFVIIKAGLQTYKIKIGHGQGRIDILSVIPRDKLQCFESLPQPARSR
jgi:hypothetical protein